MQPGSRVAVIGGGPAGSFFSTFLLDLAGKLDLELELHIYEPKLFTQAAPYGCNMCGGIISESLVQMLAAEGIELPPAVVQRGIDSYVLHTNEETVRIETPLHEKRIGAVHRGAGPRDIQEIKWHSFDGHLLATSQEMGAEVIPQRVDEVARVDGHWVLTDHEGDSRPYDLIVVATGVNAGAGKLFKDLPIAYEIPKTTKTFIREYKLGQEVLDEYMGDSMHVFLMDLPRLQFAAIIPKGDYATVCLLGDRLDNKVLMGFLESDTVRSCFPEGWEPTNHSCQCAPKISVKAAAKPYDDGLVFIGDSGATRLYKDGIGAAYKTAKAAARTAIFEGISAENFRRHYMPVCKKIERDNQLGKMAFWVAGIIQRRRFLRRTVVQMTRREQEGAARVRMSNLLWDLFTGSAPYKEIFLEGTHPVFIGRMAWHVTQALGWRPERAEP